MLISDYLNLAVANQNAGDYSNTLVFYKKALTLARKTKGTNNNQVNAILNNIKIIQNSKNKLPYTKIFEPAFETEK
jgi:hypothetical protein